MSPSSAASSPDKARASSQSKDEALEARLSDRKTTLGDLLAMEATEEERAEAMPEGVPRPEEIIAQREHAQKVLAESLRLFETKFANLPTVNRLRKLWEERRIDDKDPVWLMVEVLSLLDARSQLQFASMVRIHKAFDELAQYTAEEMRAVLNEALTLRDQIEPLRLSVEAQTRLQKENTDNMQKFTSMLPELMHVTREAIELHGGQNRRSRLETIGVVVAVLIVGVLLGAWIAR